MSHFGDFEHHLQVPIGDYIPNIWVMFNWDIYQPLSLEIFGDLLGLFFFSPAILFSLANSWWFDQFDPDSTHTQTTWTLRSNITPSVGTPGTPDIRLRLLIQTLDAVEDLIP